MIHLKQVCDTRRQRKDGSFPIVFRITFNRQQRYIPTGYYCKIEQWDQELDCLKPLNRELKLLSERLRDEEYKLLTKIREYELEHPEPENIQQIKNYLSNKKKKADLVLYFWEQEIERMKKAQRHGNAQNYKCALGAIQNHMNLKVTFNEIDYNWLVELETRLRSSGVRTNSVSVYMRTLRAVINKAINHELADANKYPFRRYKIKSESTSPRVASIDELRSFFYYHPDSGSHEFDPWMYGKLIFLLRGINFYDLALLTKDNIKHGRIIYNRSKTHKRYSVEILPQAQVIIDHYWSEERITLFPILTNEEFKNKACHPKRLAQCRKVTNKWLSRIGETLGISEKLSTYVFRYSMATACKKLGYSKDMISESLGHAYGLSVSSCYLESFDIEAIDEMQRDVVEKIITENSRE